MNSYQHISVTEDNHIVVVRLNRPEVRNAMSQLMIQELTQFAQDYRLRPDIYAIILTGTEDFFSAGADLSVAKTTSDTVPTLLELRALVNNGPDMCRAWEELEPVTIAAIDGYCVGGACALALACDFRIAGQEAMMRLPEVPLGINMSWRSLPRLASLVGASRAKQFAMFGAPTSAQKCLDWGMVDELVEPKKALNAAMEWAQKIASLPPLPIRMTKEAINACTNHNHYTSSFMDRDQYLLTFQTEDFKEGVNAFFNKRQPKFKGN